MAIEHHYPRRLWYVVGWASEFDGDGPFAREILDQPIVLFRDANGELVALEGRCPHRWAPLGLGRTEQGTLRCMYHGVKFDGAGRCVEVPGQDKIAPNLCLHAYPLIVRYKFVWLWMGEPALADPSLIPALNPLDDDSRELRTGQIDYAAEAALICDNLLDLSHISFVHENTLGKPVVLPDMEDIPEPPNVSGGNEARATEVGVRIEGWGSGARYRLDSVQPKACPNGDLWYRIDFMVPGIYYSVSRMYAYGAAVEAGGDTPGEDLIPLNDGASIQAVTPMGKGRTRYFFSITHRGGDMPAAEVDEKWEGVLEAFQEDVRMIEAQQRMIEARPQGRMGSIAVDKGLFLFRRLMARLASTEAPEVADHRS